MLNYISWNEFFVFIAILLILYYLTLWAMSYRRAIKKPLYDLQHQMPMLETPGTDLDALKTNESESTLLQEFMQQLQYYLEPYSGQRIDGLEFKEVLNGLMQQYPQLLKNSGKEELMELIEKSIERFAIEVPQGTAWRMNLK